MLGQQMNIDQLKDEIINTAKVALQKRYDDYTSDDDILTNGVIDYLHINLFRQQIRIDISNLNFYGNINYDYQAECEHLLTVDIDDIANIKQAVLNGIEAYFLQNADGLPFDYSLHMVFDYQERHNLKNTCHELINTKIINTNHKNALQKVMHEYIDEMPLHQKMVNDDRKLIFFCRYLCDFELMGYDEVTLITVIENILTNHIHKKHKKFYDTLIRHLMSYLQEWRDEFFMGRFYDISPSTFYSNDYTLKQPLNLSDDDQKYIQLFVKQAYWRIKYKDAYPQFALQDLQWAVRDFDDALAKKYLKHGTGNIADDLLTTNTDHIKAKANDVLANIDIEIKQETAQSYREALAFIIALLKQGFPKSYKISYQLKDKNAKGEKHFLNIKGLAKSSTHRFFAHALTYPNLYDDLVEYAKVAMCQFEWYGDVAEGEKSVMPSSYAVFGLALAHERYFELLSDYLQNVDDEHQSAHYEFINAFVVRWGIKKQWLTLLDDMTHSGQFHKPFKAIVQLSKDDGDIKAMLLDYIATQDKYDQESLAFLWLAKKS